MLDIIFSFILSFFLSFTIIPFVIKTAIHRNILDISDDRKSHVGAVPSLGGVGIFVSIFFVLMLTIPIAHFDNFRYILTSLGIIFLLGAQDDLRPLSPLAKLCGQLIAVTILIALADIRITQLYGLFGLDSVSYGWSVLLSMGFYLFIINSYNLVDGINGLCSSLVIVAMSLLGCWFYMLGFYEFSTFAFIVCGATLAFLKYNVTPARIFMGDTGSLVLGTVCAILMIQFLEINMAITGHPLTFDSPIIIAIGVMIIPIYDTLRVFAIRIAEGTSPFEPDRRHLHHLMLDAGLSHMQSTASLLIFNGIALLVSWQLQDINPILGFMVLVFLSILFTQIVKLFGASKPSVVRSS